jgi:hypothetical protein
MAEKKFDVTAGIVFLDVEISILWFRRVHVSLETNCRKK